MNTSGNGGVSKTGSGVSEMQLVLINKLLKIYWKLKI